MHITNGHEREKIEEVVIGIKQVHGHILLEYNQLEKAREVFLET